MVSMTDFFMIFFFGILCGLVLGGVIGIVQIKLKNNHKNQEHDNFDKRQGYL